MLYLLPTACDSATWPRRVSRRWHNHQAVKRPRQSISRRAARKESSTGRLARAAVRAWARSAAAPSEYDFDICAPARHEEARSLHQRACPPGHTHTVSQCTARMAAPRGRWCAQHWEFPSPRLARTSRPDALAQPRATRGSTPHGGGESAGSGVPARFVRPPPRRPRKKCSMRAHRLSSERTKKTARRSNERTTSATAAANSGNTTVIQ